MLMIAFTCKQSRKGARKNDEVSALVRNGQSHSQDTAIRHSCIYDDHNCVRRDSSVALRIDVSVMES